MKTIVTIFTTAIMLASYSFAGEFTGAGAAVESVLRQNNMSIASLRNSGYKVLLGEVTGAGKSIPLDAVEFVITKNALMKMKEVTHIDFKNPSAAKTLADIKALEFASQRVPMKKAQGVVFR